MIDGGGFTLSASNSSALESLFTVKAGASLELRNIVLTNEGGRAVYVESGGTLIAGEGCVFKGNTGADDGGAVYNYGTFTADSATFTDNTASDDGGAVYN